MDTPETVRLLKAAAAAQNAGRPQAAREPLESVLKIVPEHPGALNALGMLALARSAPAEAAALFARATVADPGAPPLWMNLAKAQRLLRDDEGERASLGRVLELDQRNLTGLIRMAELHQRLGEETQATQRWTAVLAVGRLVDQRPPDLDAVLGRAAAYVEQRNRVFAGVIEAGLDTAREGLERRERRRFDACIDHLLGRRPIFFNECAGLHYPFLPADEFFDREHFAWMADIEARTDAIRGELEGLLDSHWDGFQPYVKQDPGTPQNKWSELDSSLRWGAYFLWQYGERKDEACARCPQTAAALEAIPRSELAGRAPSAFFSLLRPKTRIPPHTGVTNMRAIVHLPLIVPAGCGFRVGGETRQWRIGEAFAFDDTIEHEAWNDSDELRAVLIFDTWNPHLSEVERRLLQTFFATADASGHDPGSRMGA